MPDQPGASASSSCSQKAQTIQARGSIPEFNYNASNKAQEWKRWMSQFKIYIRATGLENEGDKRKVAILLHYLGSMGLEIFNSFDLDIDTIGYSSLLTKFEEYFTPKLNLTYERHKFFTRQQQINESINDYITVLQNLSLNCQFDTLRESLVKDVFICGLNADNIEIKKRLIQENKTTLDEVVQLAQAIKHSTIQTNEISNEENVLGAVYNQNRGKGYNRGRSNSRDEGHTRSRTRSLRMSRRTEKRFLTESDEYQCPLSAETQKIAEDELRETDNSRSQALVALRSWLQQNPKFSAIRMDSSFLLRFLRSKKFSVPMAQEAIERYILLRQSWGIAFNQLDYKLPVMMELLELGYIFVSPFKDKLGRRVVIYRPGVFDPYKYTNQDMCRIMGMCYETLLEDEENQVHGVVHYADGSGVSFPHLTLFTPKEAVRIVKNGERTLPMRHKEIYGVNVHPTVKFALDFGMALISEKIKKRVKLYSAPEDVEIDKSLLPKEYGGTMPMKEMISLWIEELASKRDIVLLNDKMAVRLEMYSEAAREGAISALKAGAYTCAGADAVGDAMRGLTGNFRKLEVD